MKSVECDISDAIYRTFSWDVGCIDDTSWDVLLVLAQYYHKTEGIPIEEAGLMAFAGDMLDYYEANGIEPEEGDGWISRAHLMEWVV